MSFPQLRLGKARQWIESVFVVIMLRYSVSGGLPDHRYPDLASRVLDSFSSSAVIDVLLLAGVFALFHLEEKCGEKNQKGGIAPFTFIIAALFAVLFTIGLCCRQMGGFLILLSHKAELLLALLTAAAYTLLFYRLLRLLWRRMETGRGVVDEPGSFSRWKAAGIIFLCWLPWLLMNYPGSFCPDSLAQMAQWTGHEEWSAHHPPLSTLMMGLCWSLGKTLVNENFGAFLYCLLQAVCGAAVFSCAVCEIDRIGAGRRFSLAALLFYALTPLWGLFAQWFEKDFLYAIVFTLVMTLLLPVLKDRVCSRKSAVVIGLATTLALLLRKTAIYEIVPLLIAMLFILNKGKDRKRFSTAAGAAVMICLAVNHLLYPALGIKAASEREALSLPFQQTANYCLTYPDEVTPEEREAIDAVLDYESFQQYDPDNSDSVKNSYHGEDFTSLLEYVRVWLKMFFKHPGLYVETLFTNHWLDLTPVRPNLNVYIQADYGASPQIEWIGVHRAFGVMPTRLFILLREAFIRLPLLSLFASPGVYTWAVWICAAELLRRKQFAALALTIPGLMNIMICMASPLNGAIRYELPTVAAIPLIIGWTLIHARSESGTTARCRDDAGKS